MSDEDDRTARARIRDAAIVRFAADGTGTTSLKAIAADAGVSAPLVVHHFGSKDGLRAACDEYVAAVIRDSKHEAMAAGPALDPFQALRDAEARLPLLRYLARSLADGSPHVSTLVDELADDAAAYMEEGVRSGLLKPSDRPRERAVVLLLYTLGALVLHDHAERLLGIDLLGDADDLVAWGMVAMDILGQGIMTEGLYDKWRDALEQERDRKDETRTPT